MTREQPTGKSSSLNPRTMRSAALGGSGLVQYVAATIAPPKKIPTANPTAMWASAPPQGRWLSQPITAPRNPYSIALITASTYRDGPPPEALSQMASDW